MLPASAETTPDLLTTPSRATSGAPLTESFDVRGMITFG